MEEMRLKIQVLYYNNDYQECLDKLQEFSQYMDIFDKNNKWFYNYYLALIYNNMNEFKQAYEHTKECLLNITCKTHCVQTNKLLKNIITKI